MDNEGIENVDEVEELENTETTQYETYLEFKNKASGQAPLNANNLNYMQDAIKKDINNLEKTSFTQNITEPNTDLNDYIESGTYFFNNANTPANKPNSILAGYLEVIARNENDVKQIWHCYKDDNYIYARQKCAGTWSPWKMFLMAETEWATITTDYGTLQYKIECDKCYVIGSLTGISSSINITLPISKVKKTQAFIIAGSGTYYTKCYINANSNNLGIVAGTGTNTTTYLVDICIHLD